MYIVIGGFKKLIPHTQPAADDTPTRSWREKDCIFSLVGVPTEERLFMYHIYLLLVLPPPLS
jgi:hypothetical protein